MKYELPDELKTGDSSVDMQIWRDKFPEAFTELSEALNQPKSFIHEKCEDLIRWLRKYRHSPKGRKKDFYRFLKNCTPKGEPGGKRKVSNFDNRPSGPATLD